MMDKNNLVSKVLGQGKNIAGLVKKTARNVVLLTAAGIAAIGATRGLAETYYVYPGESVATTQVAINDPNYDTIHWTSGDYNLHPLPLNTFEVYDLAPNKNYTFDNVTISGSGLEHDGLIGIFDGGNINISAKSLTLQNSIYGIWIGDFPYDNINISGITFEVYNDPVFLENIKHDLPLTKAAVEVRNCFFNGGRIGINYGKKDQTPTEYSPYAAAYNNTGVDLEKFIIYAPKAEIVGHSIFILGNDEISENLAIGCPISNPSDFWAYESPVNIAQKDIDGAGALITGAEYYEPNGTSHIFDGENCFITDVNAFLPDGITPKRDSRLNLGGGKFIGAIEPYHELRGNLDFDEEVDFYDFAIAANRYSGNLEEIMNVTNDWLAIEPNDP